MLVWTLLQIIIWHFLFRLRFADLSSIDADADDDDDGVGDGDGVNLNVTN